MSKLCIWAHNCTKPKNVDRYIYKDDMLDDRSLQSTNDMCEAFRQHLQNRFTSFLRLKRLAEDEITKAEVYEALDRVGRGKTLGLTLYPTNCT